MKSVISVKQASKLLLLFAMLFLFLPSVLRALDGNVYLVGQDSYYHARIAEHLAEQGVPETDSFVSGERDYALSPYHVLLFFFTVPFGAVTASKIVPFLLGLLSVYLFYLILDKFRVPVWTRVAVIGIFVLSPVFIYTFNVSTPACLILVLNLAGLLFLMRQGTLNGMISLLCFSAAAAFGVVHALVSAFIVFFYSFSYKNRLKRGYWIIAAIIAVLLSYSLPLYMATEKIDFIKTDLVSSFFSDLGGTAGFSLFTLLLALVGYALVWQYKKKYYALYFFSILLIIGSFFNSELLVYSNILVVFLAGIAFMHFAEMQWSIKVLRDFTLIVLFCGFLFSAFAAVFSLQDALPNVPLVNSLVWLNLNSEEGGVVFSHYSNGFWIEFISKRPVVMDGLLDQTHEVADLYFDSAESFETDDLDRAREIFSEYGVKYVVITKNMYDGLVWDEPGRGLDFLLTNDETFKKVQENSYVAVYQYVYGGG